MLKLHNIGDDEWVFEDTSVDLTVHEQLDDAIDLWHSGKPDKAGSRLKEMAMSPLNIENFPEQH